MKDGEKPVVQIRKYSNRRYYDSTHSRHITLGQIHALVRDGRHVAVTDSGSGRNITAKVLAQIILEHDAPKLDVFPVQLLHQLIRTNDQLVTDFVDKYFNQALSAFFESQKHFEHYLRESIGLNPAAGPGAEFARAMAAPFAGALRAAGAPPRGPDRQAPTSADDQPSAEDLRAELEKMRQQLGALHERLDQAGESDSPRTPPPASETGAEP